jgi:hypothetical protein
MCYLFQKQPVEFFELTLMDQQLLTFVAKQTDQLEVKPIFNQKKLIFDENEMVQKND